MGIGQATALETELLQRIGILQKGRHSSKYLQPTASFHRGPCIPGKVPVSFPSLTQTRPYLTR